MPTCLQKPSAHNLVDAELCFDVQMKIDCMHLVSPAFYYTVVTIRGSAQWSLHWAEHAPSMKGTTDPLKMGLYRFMHWVAPVRLSAFFIKKKEAVFHQSIILFSWFSFICN